MWASEKNYNHGSFRPQKSVGESNQPRRQFTLFWTPAGSGGPRNKKPALYQPPGKEASLCIYVTQRGVKQNSLYISCSHFATTFMNENRVYILYVRVGVTSPWIYNTHLINQTQFKLLFLCNNDNHFFTQSIMPSHFGL